MFLFNLPNLFGISCSAYSFFKIKLGDHSVLANGRHRLSAIPIYKGDFDCTFNWQQIFSLLSKRLTETEIPSYVNDVLKSVTH